MCCLTENKAWFARELCYDQLYPSASLTDCQSDAQPRHAAEVHHSVLRPGPGRDISRTGVCMVTARVRSSPFPHLSLLVSITCKVLTFTSYGKL